MSELACKACFLTEHVYSNYFDKIIPGPRPSCERVPPGPMFPQPTMMALHGTTPIIDGIISEGEWMDATSIVSTIPFNTPQFSPVNNASDLRVNQAWVKYDRDGLFFAFDIIDNIAYSKDTPWWEPTGNPNADLLNRTGWPWFGDEMEIIVNAQPGVSGHLNTSVVGNASQWQMCVNTCKSRLGGRGVGGLIEAEPRSDNGTAWRLYREWIENGTMRAATKPRQGQHGYILEWFVSFQAVVLEDGQPFSPTSNPADVRIGINVALGDVDDPAVGDKTFGFHHENWISGKKNTRTQLNELATMWLVLPSVVAWPHQPAATPSSPVLATTGGTGNQE